MIATLRSNTKYGKSKRPEDIYCGAESNFSTLYEYKILQERTDIKSLEYIVPIKEIPPKEVSQYFIVGKLADGYNIIKPIPVKVIQDGDEIIADIPELEIYAFGSDIGEVIEEIKEELVELYDVLISEDALGSYPKKWKKTITSLINKNGA
jgi:hypothetical protein